MNIGLKSIGLFAALTIAAFAGACGPAAPAQTVDDKTVQPTSSGTAVAPPADTGAATTPSATPSATPGGTTEPKPAGTGAAAAGGGPAASVPITASKMLEDLKKAGVNLAKISELEKLPLATKKKVMPLMQKAMGYTACTGCHVEGDFKAETRNMKVSREMWRHYVTELRDEKAGALFCDSCHSGQVKVLNRTDKEALKDFMEKEYEHKLTRTDKKDHECSTCHGDAMEMKIIERLWKIPLEAKK